MDQDVTRYRGSLGPGDIVLDWDPIPSQKGAQQPPTCRPMSIVAKRLSCCALVTQIIESDEKSTA